MNETKFFLVHLKKVRMLDALWSCNMLPLTETLPFAFVEIKLWLKLKFLPSNFQNEFYFTKRWTCFCGITNKPTKALTLSQSIRRWGLLITKTCFRQIELWSNTYKRSYGFNSGVHITFMTIKARKIRFPLIQSTEFRRECKQFIVQSDRESSTACTELMKLRLDTLPFRCNWEHYK